MASVDNTLLQKLFYYSFNMFPSLKTSMPTTIVVLKVPVFICLFRSNFSRKGMLSPVVLLFLLRF